MLKILKNHYIFIKHYYSKNRFICNDNRWITFDCGNLISLYNRKYDEKLIKETDLIHFNQAYLDDFNKLDSPKKNNVVILNFEVDDLKEEYKRIKDLGIGDVSEILYVNVHLPYYYFNVIDPDGNVLEITGKYEV